MRKALGLVACVAVVTGSLWVLGGGRPARLASAQTDSGSYDAAARRLLQEAKNLAMQGNAGEAIRRARAAEALNVTWGDGEQTPAQFLQALSGQTSAAGQTMTLDDPWDTPLPEPAKPAASADPFAAPAQAAGQNESPSRKAQAIALLRQARVALAREDYEEARTRALQARQLGVAFGLFDDRPEHVLSEIKRLSGQTTIVGAAAQPATRTNPVHPDQNRDTAVALVQSAREDLQAGRLESAQEKAGQAQTYNVTFGPQEDSPAMILSDIARLANAAQASASAQSAARAVALVQEARQALTEGRLSIARERAIEATKLNGSFGPTDDRPEVILAEIQQMLSGPASVATAATPADFAPAANQGTVTAPEASLSDFGVINPGGSSAVESFDRGVVLLRQNDLVAAKAAFLEVERSGEQLDGLRQEQLKLYLKQLQNVSDSIELASAQDSVPVRSAADTSEFGAPLQIQQPGQDSQPAAEDVIVPATPAVGAQSAMLDDVAQQQAVKYDRMRTEVLNSVFRAEKLRDTNPDGAVEILDRTVASVEAADLAPEARQTLLGYLKRSQEAVNAYAQERAPLIELEQRNAEVREALKARTAETIRIEQEYAKLVEQYDELLNQRRYAEAGVVAKKAFELQPKNPVSIVMVEKAKFARRIGLIDDVKRRREDGAWRTLQDVEESLIPNPDEITYPDARRWDDLTKSRKRYGRSDGRNLSPKELEIEESLSNPISLHFSERPLTEVIQHISMTAGVNIVVDGRALEEEDVPTDEPVSIDVDGIKLQSALNLLLEPYGLTYGIENEVLKITSKLRQEVDYIQRVYPVADLVIPIRDTVAPSNSFGTVNRMNDMIFGGSAGMGGQAGNTGGVGLFQVTDNAGRRRPGGSASSNGTNTDVDFESLVDLIISTVDPKSWIEGGGEGSIKGNENTLSLVIRTNQAVHEQIADLLDQLRRLQDLQVTVEVRFISVTDRFFERIGIDFDFNVQDTVGDVPGLPAFGSRQLTFPGQGQQGGGGQQQGGDLRGQVGGQQGQQGGQQGGGTSLFDPVFRVRPSRDDFKSTVVGLASPDQFTEDFDVQFRQGSFEIGVPDFGNFNPDAGIQVGMAILSDLEAFFFLQAAQADERANLLFAPKVTLFNGSSAILVDQVQRPFVIALVPSVGTGSVGFTPIIQVIPDGINLNVTAVISADRRYVRLSL